MAWCPKCGDEAQLFITTEVTGYIGPDNHALEDYPEINLECAKPDDKAVCSDCEYTAPLKEFVKPEEKQ